MCYHCIYVLYMSGKYKYPYRVSESVPPCLFLVSSPVTYSTSCMYAVINVITIIKHQLRCIGQVTFFLFLVHSMGSCHLSI